MPTRWLGRWPFALLLVLAPVLAAADEAPTGAEAIEAVEVWAGHQLFIGSRTVPILGELQTRSQTFLLSTVERRDGEIRLHQRLCKMEVDRFAGVRVSFLQEGVRKMPPTQIVFRPRGEDRFEAVPWTTSWTTEDVDGDGKPGATVQVEAPICGGTVLVGSTSRSMARGSSFGGGLEGELRVSVAQRILETSKGCISVVAHDSEDRMVGTFRYVPVPKESTCASLLEAGWPAQASEPKRGGDERKERPRSERLRR